MFGVTDGIYEDWVRLDVIIDTHTTKTTLMGGNNDPRVVSAIVRKCTLLLLLLFFLLLLYDIPTIYGTYERVLQNNLKCKLSIL